MRFHRIASFIVSLSFVLISCRFASAQIDIPTWQVDTSHSGVNPTEQVLTPQFVSGSGNITCLYAEQVDGQVNAQPLYLTKATLASLPGSFGDSQPHNAVYVATQNGTVYAIDADRTSDNCTSVNQNYLWKMPLVNYPNGPTPHGVAQRYIDVGGAHDITPLLGLTETPVIDTRTGILYVVVAVKDTQDLPSEAPYAQVLYALDVKTGDVKGFTVIKPEFNGDFQQQHCSTGPGDPTPNHDCDQGQDPDIVTPSGPGKIPFNPKHEHLRSALVLDAAHNTIYMAFAAHNDQLPYEGLVLAYNISDPGNMTLQGEFNAHPTGTDEEAGIWMGGASPAFDPKTNQLFFATGNGSWNQNSSGSDSNGLFTTGTDLAMSVLSLSTDPSTIVNYRGEPEMQIPFSADSNGNFHWFTPSQWDSFNNGDRDLGSGGVLLLPPLLDGNGETRNLMIMGGKAAVLYLLDRTNLGGHDNNDPSNLNPNAVQQITESGGQMFNTPTYYNGSIYYSVNAALQKRLVGWSSATQTFISPTETMSTQGAFNKTAGNFISASSLTGNGVVWEVSNGIFAWNTKDVTNTIYNTQTSLPVKGGQCTTATWALPIVNNGKVYFSCYENNGTTDPSQNTPGYLFVYGPAPIPTGAPTGVPELTSVTAANSNDIDLQWTYDVGDAAGFIVLRSTGNANNFGKIFQGNDSTQRTFSDTTVSPGTTYFYEVQAFNIINNAVSNSVSSQPLWATTPGQFAQDGLVAYWSLDEGVRNSNPTSSMDVTGNGHTAVEPPGGEENAIPGGVVNGAWQFHGTHNVDRLEVTDAPDLDFKQSQSFTLSAWVNAGSVGGDLDGEHPGESSLIVKSADQGALYGLYINSAGFWAARGPAGDIVSDQKAVQSQWTHLALVQDGVHNIRNLYVNGVLQSKSLPAQDANGMGKLWFGEQNAVNPDGSPDNNGVDGFEGVLDEIRIYNRALSASEIQDLRGDPVLNAISSLPSGPAGTQAKMGVPLFPSPVPLTDPRVPENQSYTIQVQFAAPVTGIPTVELQGQPGTTSVIGQVGSPSLDATQTFLTVPLTGVQNVQALDLHISNITSGSVVTSGTQDIPFNVLYGDVSQDHKIDDTDSAAVNNHTSGAVNMANAIFDLNGDGIIDQNDVNVVTQNAGITWTAPGDTNLAFFRTKNVFASSTNGGNVATNAFDNNLNDNWESEHANSVIPDNTPNTGVPGVDPSFLVIDLGAPATVDGFAIQWGGSAGNVYTIDACTGTVNSTTGACSSIWHNMATESNNPNNNDLKSYTNLQPVTAEFFRMNGTARVNAPFGYQINEFNVFGSFLPSTVQPVAPTITSPATATAIVEQPMTPYTITANATGVTFGAAGLPDGLSLNGAVISGTPTKSGVFTITLSATATSTNQTGTATLTLTVSNPPAPAITSPATATAIVGQSLTPYTITSNPAATTFGATGLPNGLSLNGPVISGTPTTSGTFTINLSATDSLGQTGTATLILTVVPAAVPPAAPANLTATVVSASQINLTWTASTTQGVTYSVFRSTTSGFTPSTNTQITSNLTATSFSDTGLTASTTYFYVVEAVNTVDVAPSTQVSATTSTAAPSTEVVAIDAGNAAPTAIDAPFVSETPFISDTNVFNPGQTITIPAAIANIAAPPDVYASAHQGGNFTYTIPITNPAPSGFYTVVLHFAELFFNAANQRLFNVAINNTPVPQLQNFDIFANAGNARYTAVVRTIPNVTAVGNQITIQFSSGAADQPMVNGIEIQAQSAQIAESSATPPTNVTTNVVAPSQVNLTWTASTTSGVMYSVFRSTTSGFTPSAATQIATHLAASSFSDIGLAPSTTYYYVVEAVNTMGGTPSSQATATTPAVSTDIIAIDAGSATNVFDAAINTNFVAEAPYVMGGGDDAPNQSITIPAAIASIAAPVAVYANAHQGGSTYTIPITAPSPTGTYTVILHFAELFFDEAQKRVFNVAINNVPVPELQNFDIFASAGNANFTAVVKTISNVMPVNNQITITFSNGTADQPMVNGIEIR